jgi:hypothetical protein
MGFSEEQDEKMNLERFREHQKKLTKMEEDRPKLYGLMMKHMSVESKDEVTQEPDYDVWHAEKDPEKLWQAIVKTHKVDCVSNVTAVKELTSRKAYQNIKQGPFESLAQYSERFRDTYRAYKATGTPSRPVDVPENEQALDFFHGLDQRRYATFKTSMLNGWATKAFDLPQTVNDIYRLAGTWVRPSSKSDGGTAATYVTIEEEAKQRAKQDKKIKKKEKRRRSQRQLWQPLVRLVQKEATMGRKCQKIYRTSSALDARRKDIIRHQKIVRFIQVRSRIPVVS